MLSIECSQSDAYNTYDASTNGSESAQLVNTLRWPLHPPPTHTFHRSSTTASRQHSGQITENYCTQSREDKLRRIWHARSRLTHTPGPKVSRSRICEHNHASHLKHHPNAPVYHTTRADGLENRNHRGSLVSHATRDDGQRHRARHPHPA